METTTICRSRVLAAASAAAVGVATGCAGVAATAHPISVMSFGGFKLPP